MKYYVADAFAEKVFEGNPAGVIVRDEWLPDDLMQKIAIENNLSETAFTVKESDDRYRLRWFTPGGEVDLCGHATLGTAFILTSFYEKDIKKIYFDTLSGELTAERKGDLIEMVFPDLEPDVYDSPEVKAQVEDALGVKIKSLLVKDELVAVLDSADAVRGLEPDFEKVNALEGIGLIVTAAGDGDFDFVSRCFYPKLTVNEDPVTGRAHARVTPYWAKALGKNDLKARQASKRGGTLYCSMKGGKVMIAGPAVLYSEAEIHV